MKWFHKKISPTQSPEEIRLATIYALFRAYGISAYKQGPHLNFWNCLCGLVTGAMVDFGSKPKRILIACEASPGDNWVAGYASVGRTERLDTDLKKWVAEIIRAQDEMMADPEHANGISF